MGNFSNNAITDVGRMLLADVQAGAIFTPTRIVMGSGSMPSGATPQGMTDVITPVKSLAINKKKRTPDGKCVFGGVYTNEEVTEPFYFRELALYAKAVYLNEDGSVKSEGAETLYSYGNAGATADYMPAHSTSTVVEKQMDLVTWVGNDAQVDLTIESGLYATMEYVDDAINNHEHSAEDITEGAVPIEHGGTGAVDALNALANLFALNLNHITETKFNVPAGANLNDYTTPGAYRIPTATVAESLVNGPAYISAGGRLIVSAVSGLTAGIFQVIIYNTAFTQIWYRVITTEQVIGQWKSLPCYDSTYTNCLFYLVEGGREWITPPYVPGTEYRTIERRDGKIVYKKLDTDGVLKYRMEGSTAWNPCAAENGGVRKTGDTMTNDLTIQKAAAPSLRLNEGSNGAGAIVQMWGNQLIIANRVEANVVDNYRFFSVNNLAQQDDVAYALGLADIRAGVSKYYTVLHSGNLHVFGLGVAPASVE